MKNQLILGDNLEVLRDIPSESIDLIYIDPPFFSNRHYEVIWGDEGEVASFNDRWAGGINHYIDWLYKRVEQLYRVLKPTGSFYLHCDWHANAYIRVLILDKIFGDKNFVNEIVWHYSGWNKKLKLGVEKRCDTIFFYTKTKQAVFNSIVRPWKNENEYIKTRNKKVYIDEKGDKYLWSDGGNGKKVRRYIKDAMKYGRPTDNLWLDIDKINNNSKERIGYPTQKPEALLERIIKASSNPGDIVLDAFCGGGTTPAVARRLGRKFIGIDQSVRAIEITDRRLQLQKSADDYDMVWWNVEECAA